MLNRIILEDTKLSIYVVGLIEMFVRTVFENECRDSQQSDGIVDREWRIGCVGLIFESQIGSILSILLKKGIKIVEKRNPMLEITLRTTFVDAPIENDITLSYFQLNPTSPSARFS